MNAQNIPNIPAEAPTENGIDPLGPIVVPTRSRIGARALALVGTVSLAALGVAAVADTCSTWPTID
jgi:hypothetical protein